MKIQNKIPSVEYKKILYATDLSESGRHAFPHAAGLSRRYGAELTVLHVVHGGPELDRRLFGYVDEELWEEIKTRNLREARDILLERKRDNVAIKESIGQFHDEVQAEFHALARESVPGLAGLKQVRRCAHANASHASWWNARCDGFVRRPRDW